MNLRAKYCLGGWGRVRQLSYIIGDCQKLVDIRAIWVCRGHISKPASVVANKRAIQFYGTFTQVNFIQIEEKKGMSIIIRLIRGNVHMCTLSKVTRAF